MKSGAAEYQEHMQYALILLTNAVVYGFVPLQWLQYMW